MGLPGGEVTVVTGARALQRRKLGYLGPTGHPTSSWGTEEPVRAESGREQAAGGRKRASRAPGRAVGSGARLSWSTVTPGTPSLWKACYPELLTGPACPLDSAHLPWGRGGVCCPHSGPWTTPTSLNVTAGLKAGQYRGREIGWRPRRPAGPQGFTGPGALGPDLQGPWEPLRSPVAQPC